MNAFFEGERMKITKYFSKAELALWLGCMLIIITAFLIFDRANYLILFASLIGTTSLIFNAKGNPFGQFLMVVFSIIYGTISYNFAYYGEMVTYIGMTMPMAAFSLISWLKNPYKGNRAEVKINTISFMEIIFMCALSVIVTVVFYFVLAYFNTANIILSTLSVTTSFAAVYLTFRRSVLFAICYAANDIVLIALWVLAAMQNSAYIAVAICFAMFFVNDIYCFVNWSKMKKRQERYK